MAEPENPSKPGGGVVRVNFRTRGRVARSELDTGFEARLAALRSFMDKDLFFIGGVPKSGTTWLRVMLDAHPAIACGGEGHLANQLATTLRDALNRHNRLVNTRNQTTFESFPPFPLFDAGDYHFLLISAIALLLMRIEGADKARWIGEKTPDNVLNFRLLATLFPRARFLHIVRDGRDCAVSSWFHNMRVDPDETLRQHPTIHRFIANCADAWATALQEDQVFAAEHPGRGMTVRYEDLLDHPTETLRGILTFLEVPEDAAAVSRCIALSRFERMSGGRAAGQEDRGSFLRLGCAGDWVNHFTPEMNEAFLRVCGEEMARMGYEV